jgi:DNA ligase-1
MYSKFGEELLLPPILFAGIPKVALDGQLWAENQSLKSLIYSGVGDWQSVKYTIFDLPNSNDPYETRMTKLKEMKFPGHIQIVESVRIQDLRHLEDILGSIFARGGKGAIAKESSSCYTPGKTNKILELKVTIEFDIVTYFSEPVMNVKLLL